MKTLKKITNEKDVLKLQELSHKYKNACATENWRKIKYMEQIQYLLGLYKEKYCLTETDWAKLYFKFVLS
jgi:hypothetical protein